MIAALMAATLLTAQEKKKGGLMNALKKGVESSTGLNVSKETLFVYPEIGIWKMSLVSCTGDPATGNVEFTINGTKLDRTLKNEHWVLREAVVSGTTEKLGLKSVSADPFFDFEQNIPTKITFTTILGVPAEAKSIDVKFSTYDRNLMFEARDVPIEWVEKK
jgi:hypothetical protein